VNAMTTLKTEPSSLSLLHIEDITSDTHLISLSLRNKPKKQYQVVNVHSLKEAFEQLEQSLFDIVFLDLPLTNTININNLEKLRQCYPELPIIVLTDTHDEQIIRQIIRAGAQDYVHKDEYDPDIVSRVIHYAIDRKQTELELEQLARYDPLTGLVNRAVFIDRLDRCLIRIQRTSGQVGVMLLDLDNFKDINDTLGHSVGDELLIQVAERIKACIRQLDTLSRLGGDEFTLLFEQTDESPNLQTVAKKILAAISEPFYIQGETVFTSGSLGISLPMKNEEYNSNTLLKNADIAMYLSKQKGGNQFTFFTRELQISAQIRNNLENSLRRAIENNELFLCYQPQIDLRTQTIYGAEALIRWRHPEHGVVPPATFIPILEDTGLIILATEWVIKEALTTWKHWLDTNIVTPDATISVNLSPKFMRYPKIHETLDDILTACELPASAVELEFTENIFIDANQQNLDVLYKLKETGFSLSIDDFGTGYSSLSYLKDFPIDCIKLDRAFIKDIVNSPKDAAIASVIIELGHKLGMNVIAEGVDEETKLQRLKEYQCHLIQGFYFSKPLEKKDFEHYLQKPIDVQV